MLFVVFSVTAIIYLFLETVSLVNESVGTLLIIKPSCTRFMYELYDRVTGSAGKYDRRIRLALGWYFGDFLGVHPFSLSSEPSLSKHS